MEQMYGTSLIGGWHGARKDLSHEPQIAKHVSFLSIHTSCCALDKF